MYTTSKFIRAEGNRNITRQDDREFFFMLQRSVLLSLKEAGFMTEMQYRNAEEILKEQQRTIVRSKAEGGGNLL